MQAASVTPVSRDGTPMALLRPMKAVESSSSSSGEGAWQQQQASGRVVPKEETEVAEEVAAGSTNVQLVRPQDLHAVPSQVPETSEAQPSTSAQQQVPVLKRTRPAEVVPTEEPQARTFSFLLLKLLL